MSLLLVNHSIHYKTWNHWKCIFSHFWRKLALQLIFHGFMTTHFGLIRLPICTKEISKKALFNLRRKNILIHESSSLSKDPSIHSGKVLCIFDRERRSKIGLKNYFSCSCSVFVELMMQYSYSLYIYHLFAVELQFQNSEWRWCACGHSFQGRGDSNKKVSSDDWRPNYYYS